MSQLFVDDVVSKEGTNSVGFSKGISVSVASTFSGDVSIGGTLTYEDVTNVDAVGLITARGGIKLGAAGIGGTFNANGDTTLAGVVTATSFSGDGSALTGMANTANVSTTGLNVVGVSTLGNDVTFVGAAANITFDQSTDDLIFNDGARAVFGTGSDGLEIKHVGDQSYITDSGTGQLYIQGSTFVSIRDADDGDTLGKFIKDGAVELYYNNTKRIETTSSGAITSGIHTVTVGTDLDGYKVEEGSYDTNALNGEFDFEFENGHVQTHTGSTAGTYFPDFRVSSSQSLSSVMGVGDVVSATLIVTASNTAHYCTAGIKIDNSTSNVTIEWIGSSAPSAGKGAGYDIYSFTIQKTAATPAYLVIVNATDAG